VAFKLKAQDTKVIGKPALGMEAKCRALRTARPKETPGKEKRSKSKDFNFFLLASFFAVIF
jgi:hypothetical protein